MSSDLIGNAGIEKLSKNVTLLVPDVANSLNRILPFLEFTVHQVPILPQICATFFTDLFKIDPTKFA
jgi:hypothetical protein